MLKLINLFVIKSIFDKHKVSPLSQMIYINCLTHHFKDLDATEENSMAFELFESDFEYEKYKLNFQELHKAKLIVLDNRIIRFNNTWGTFIDRTMLTKKEAKKDIYKCLDGQEFLELVCMKNKVNMDAVKVLIGKFIKEQIALGKNHYNESDCRKHFLYWVRFNVSEGQIVKSKGKILAR
jgi:hypothetical protein